MAIETSVNKEWSVRLLLITVAFGFFGGWSLYDGIVGYPEARELYRMTHDNTDGKSVGELLDREAWEDEVVEAGYDPELIAAKAHKLKPKSDFDVIAQFVMATICFPVALMAFVWMLHHARRKPRVDDSGLIFAGTTVPFDAIGEIDKTLWGSKGIATIHYEVQGTAGRFKMDDWKYKDADKALAFIEDKLGRRPDEFSANSETPAPAEAGA